jgi:hypothetical protein
MVLVTGVPLDAMKGCKAWAKPAHALYEKQHNNPS